MSADNLAFFDKFIREQLPDFFERPAAGVSLLEGFQHLVDQCLPGLLGFQFETLTAEECVGWLPFRRKTTGIHGLMHGGALFSAGDTLTAMQSILNGDENSKNVLTADASIRYLRPVDGGRVRVVSKVTRRDGAKVYMQCDFFNEAGKRVARSRYVYVIVS